MKLAIRKHWLDFLAIIGLIVISGAVSIYILDNQRLKLPAWVPVVGKDFFVIKADMTTAQAVTPGQGQTVNIAGVQVGEISRVELKDGKARITLRMEPRYGRVYKNATVLLRPKTGLKDMVAELEPGTPAAGRLKDGGVIPVSQTLPDVNLDEVLASLDTDTRDYLTILLGAGAEGVRGNGRELANAIRRFEPSARYGAKVFGPLAERRKNIKRVIHNLSLVMDELGAKDDQLAEFVENSNAVFAILTRQDANLRATLSELPASLTATQRGLGKAKTLADELGPTLQALRPGARALGPTLRQVRPFVRETTPILRDEIRPFVRASRPTVKELQAGDARPRRRRARPRALLQGRQPPARHAGLQPAGQGGGLPVLGRLGQPPRQPALHDAGRARPDPPRPLHHHLPGRAGARPGRGVEPAAGHAHRAAQPAEAELPELDPRPGGRRIDAEGRPLLQPRRHHGRLRAVLLRAAAVPVARVRRRRSR